MHVCIMSSLLQQVEESIGLFISGLRQAKTGGLLAHGRAHGHAHRLLALGELAGRPGFFVFVI